jgi:hypothetical protein
MSFYLTLPSNSSMEFYPNNTLQSFTTRLKTGIELHGKYEVALSEIMVPKEFKTSFGFIEMIKEIDKKEEEYNIEIDLFDKKSIDQNLKQINLNIKSVTNGEDLKFKLNSSNDKIQMIIKNGWQVSLPLSIMHLFKFKMPEGDVFIQSNPKIEQFFDSNTFEKDELTKESINSVPALYVYCDQVDFQHVGDNDIRLLKIVAVPSLSKEKYTIVNFVNPNYVQVRSASFSDISIQFYSDEGKKIKFGDGEKLYVKLHFRPK